MPTITPFLWFNGHLEDAITFYTSIFDDALVTQIARYPDGAPGRPGDVMTARFRLAGQEFLALNGGPQFEFTPAVSFLVTCADQDDVDYYWDRLTDDGEPGQCGWLVDRFGLSWQVVPRILDDLMHDEDPQRATRVTQALLGMTKINVAGLEAAYEAAAT